MLAKDLMLPTTEVVHLDQSLKDAADRLRRFGLPLLPVVDGDEIVGVVTGEALEEMAAAEVDLAHTAVRDHMSAEVSFCRPDESVQTARAIMEKGGHRRLLVVDDKGRLCGLLASTDAEARGNDKSVGAAAGRTVKTPGRATGGPLHRPPNFSTKPVIKK